MVSKPEAKRKYLLFADAMGGSANDCSCTTCVFARKCYDQAVKSMGEVCDILEADEVAELTRSLTTDALCDVPEEQHAATHVFVMTFSTMVTGALVSGLLEFPELLGILRASYDRAERGEVMKPSRAKHH